MTAPATSTCVICHRYPARVFSIRRHVGMLVLQRFVKSRAAFCRDHALQLTKEYTGKTLWQGWWGYISFFVNWFVLAANLNVHIQAKSMEAPQSLPEMPPAPPTAALDAI